MDEEIAAIASKVGLPWFRYLSFANAPVRKRADADCAALCAAPLAEVADALRQGPKQGEATRAETPAASAAEASIAAAHAFGSRPEAAPHLERSAGAPAAPGSCAEVRTGGAATADFLLLRIVDEQLRSSASPAHPGRHVQHAGAGRSRGDRPFLHEGSQRPAAPARTELDLAG